MNTIAQSQTRKKKGFTLIELMIAISIIAVLATVGFSTYNQSQIRARDLKRKQDLRSIATSLELYFQKNQRFPCTTGLEVSNSGANWLSDVVTGTAPCNSTAIPFNSSYINPMPLDPLNTGANPRLANNFSYGYAATGGDCGSVPGGYYFLITQLENANDQDSCTNKQYKYCDGVVFCGAPKNYAGSSYIITSN